MLATKCIGTVYAVLATNEQIAVAGTIQSAEYFRFRLHGANVRVRELGDDHTVKTIRIKDGDAINDVHAIIRKKDAGSYRRVPFFEEESLANTELAKARSKNPNAQMLTLQVLTNMTKSDQKELS